MVGGEMRPQRMDGENYESDNYDAGYNQACCDWEEYSKALMDEEELARFLKSYKELECVDECYLERLAKAIKQLWEGK